MNLFLNNYLWIFLTSIVTILSIKKAIKMMKMNLIAGDDFVQKISI